MPQRASENSSFRHWFIDTIVSFRVKRVPTGYTSARIFFQKSVPGYSAIFLSCTLYKAKAYYGGGLLRTGCLYDTISFSLNDDNKFTPHTVRIVQKMREHLFRLPDDVFLINFSKFAGDKNFSFPCPPKL